MIDEFYRALRNAAPGHWIVQCHIENPTPLLEYIVTKITRICGGEPQTFRLAITAADLARRSTENAVHEVIGETSKRFHESAQNELVNFCSGVLVPWLQRLYQERREQVPETWAYLGRLNLILGGTKGTA